MTVTQAPRKPGKPTHQEEEPLRTQIVGIVLLVILLLFLGTWMMA